MNKLITKVVAIILALSMSLGVFAQTAVKTSGKYTCVAEIYTEGATSMGLRANVYDNTTNEPVVINRIQLMMRAVGSSVYHPSANVNEPSGNGYNVSEHQLPLWPCQNVSQTHVAGGAQFFLPNDTVVSMDGTELFITNPNPARASSAFGDLVDVIAIVGEVLLPVL